MSTPAKEFAEAIYERRPFCLIGSPEQQWRTFKSAEVAMCHMYG